MSILPLHPTALLFTQTLVIFHVCFFYHLPSLALYHCQDANLATPSSRLFKCKLPVVLPCLNNEVRFLNEEQDRKLFIYLLPTPLLSPLTPTQLPHVPIRNGPKPLTVSCLPSLLLLFCMPHCPSLSCLKNL